MLKNPLSPRRLKKVQMSRGFAGRRVMRGARRSKYPPAEPGALRALAPQRGLTARGGPSEYNIGTPLRLVHHCHIVSSLRKSTLPELSNSGVCIELHTPDYAERVNMHSHSAVVSI
jgi:hypothetical protein